MLDDRLLCDWKTLKLLGWPYSRTHTMRLVKAGRFPKPIKFGDHRNARIAWRYADIQEYLKRHHVDTVTAMCKF
jgi:prophage regulatory protein